METITVETLSGTTAAGEQAYEEAIDSLARRIVDLRLDMPAALLLEIHLPLVTLFHSAALLLEPVAAIFAPAERIQTLKLLFSERQRVEALIRRIETYAIAKRNETTER